MAIWDDGGINSNETSFVFNRLYDKKSTAIVRKKKGFLYAALGKPNIGKGDKVPPFERQRNITGNKIEVRLLGELDTPVALARANQLDDVTLTWNSDARGGSQFGVSQWPWTKPIVRSEIDRFRGDEAKTLSYLDEIFEEVMLSFEKAWSTALNQVGSINYNASESALGSYLYAIMGIDGAWTTNPDTYGDLNRQDSGNSDYRGYYLGSAGTLTLPKIFTAKLAIEDYGGNATAGFASSGVYSKINQLLENQVYVTYSEEWNQFSGSYLKYNGTVFCYDPDTPSGYLSLITPESWRLYKRDDAPFTEAGLVPAFWKKGQPYVLPVNVWMQMICRHPAQNGILAGITV